MKKNVDNLWKDLAVLFLPLIIISVVLLVVSCKMTTEGIESVDGDVTIPELTEYLQVDSSTFELTFSEVVELSDITILKEDIVVQSFDNINIEDIASVIQNEEVQEIDCKKRIVLKDDVELEIGQEYSLYGVATDLNGNSLSFSIPFYGFNTNVAGLVLSEVRSDASKTKVEFVELYAYKAGNLGGVVLYNASDDDKEEYVFPAVEVQKGEYIVVHFRKLEDQAINCIDETENDLNLSSAADSCSDSRDFWVNASEARIGKSDVILLRERMGGNLLDCVAYAEEDLLAWKNDAYVMALTEAVNAEVWQGGVEVTSAASSQGITNTRTLSRQNINQISASLEKGEVMPPNDKSCWLITKTSSASPGRENSSEPYIK